MRVQMNYTHWLLQVAADQAALIVINTGTNTRTSWQSNTTQPSVRVHSAADELNRAVRRHLHRLAAVACRPRSDAHAQAAAIARRVRAVEQQVARSIDGRRHACIAVTSAGARHFHVCRRQRHLRTASLAVTAQRQRLGQLGIQRKARFSAVAGNRGGQCVLLERHEAGALAAGRLRAVEADVAIRCHATVWA